MDTCKTDLIYNWLAAAISHDKSTNRKYYFDFSDKTFFYLIENSNRYSVDATNTFSAEDENLLLSKINKVAVKDASILEIKKSRKDYSHLFDQTTSYENYTKREEQWGVMHEEIQAFLILHAIDLKEASLIQ